MLNTPVAYIIFNRPRHTRETFAAIRAQRPAKMFIIADGPRPGHPTDAECCQKVLKIVEDIDWPCEIHRNYAEHNLGCKQRVITGLDWVFEQVEKAIIIEDDVLPHPDFYPYCDALLERYEDDERVMVITACNFQNGQRRGDSAYYFSKYNHVWGWATWRRAWIKNDHSLKFWPKWKKSEAWLRHISDKIERSYWSNIFDRMYRNEIDTWDYPWMASVWYHGGLTATPNVNMVTNIGFGPDSTHTVADVEQSGCPAFPLGLLTHPDEVVQDQKADRFVYDHHYCSLDDRFYRRMFLLPGRVVGNIIRIMRCLIDFRG